MWKSDKIKKITITKNTHFLEGRYLNVLLQVVALVKYANLI